MPAEISSLKTSDVALVRLEVVTTQIVVAQLRTSHIRAVGILGNVVMKCMQNDIAYKNKHNIAVIFMVKLDVITL